MTRRPLFKDPGELQKKVDDFFIYCDKEGKRPTVTRLALYLGTCRKYLNNYENKVHLELPGDVRDSIAEIITMAKARIEVEYEDMLFARDTFKGAQFVMTNNYAYSNKAEVHTTGETTVNQRMDLTSLSTEDIKRLLEEEE